MERNIKVARAHRACSWLYAIFTVVGIINCFTAYEFTKSLPLYVLLIPILMAGLFTLHHLTGKAAKEKKPWALYTSRAIAVFMLIGFPLGTLIGIYLLYNCWGGWKSVSVNTASA